MEKRVQDYTSEILEVVKSNASPAVLCQRLQDYHENDIADILEKLSPAERCKLYRILDMDTISDIFEYTEEADVVKYLEEMNIRKAAAILSKMDTNVLSDVLQQFDRSKRKIFIELLDDEVRHDIEMINSFDEDEIGSRMTTNYIVIHENLTVKEAMTELVSQAAKNDNISTIFVITASEEFYGAIDLKDLIIARRDHPLEELIVTSYPYVYGTDLIDECIEDLKDYSEDSIPVLDNDNRLLGVITSANIVDLVNDEMGDDVISHFIIDKIYDVSRGDNTKQTIVVVKYRDRIFGIIFQILDTFINQISTIHIRIRSYDQFFKRVIAACNDQIFQINGTIKLFRCSNNKNSRNIVIFSSLRNQFSHGFFDSKILVDDNIICCHTATDFIFIERIDHFDVVTNFVIQ